MTRFHVKIGEIRPSAAAQAQLETGLLAALEQQHAKPETGGLASAEKTGSARAEDDDVKIGPAAEAQRTARIVSGSGRVYNGVPDRRSIHAGFVAYEVQPCQ